MSANRWIGGWNERRRDWISCEYPDESDRAMMEELEDLLDNAARVGSALLSCSDECFETINRARAMVKDVINHWDDLWPCVPEVEDLTDDAD